MLGAAIIVFREVLEAALIIGIISAATHGIKNRSHWIWAGVFAGLLGAGVVASITSLIAEMASGFGQELFNIFILCVAILMLAWHNIWMSHHGKAFAKQANSAGLDIKEGRSEISALFLIVALAVLREGSETVLFLYGIATANSASMHTTLVGGLLGLAGGCAIGFLLYLGLLSIPIRWFFKVTGTMVLLLAAGMASQVAQLLIQADVISYLAMPLWDSSRLIAQDSALGTFLHAFAGYDAEPTGLQLLFFGMTILLISVAMKLSRDKH
ncbi:MAG: FTR1 family iron permease [Candidatus Methylopumilus sp.]